MNYYLGIDAGSSYIKLALVDEAETLAFHDVVLRGADIDTSCRICFQDMLNRCQIDKNQIDGIIATGYGRKQVTFSDDIITEITALAVGSYAVDQAVRCVIDIGGQDSKVVAINQSGKVLDFMMNNKCSAGTGKFLEVTSTSLDVPVEQLGALSKNSGKVLKLSSTCTVFAESEVISCIARGENKEDIIRALLRSISGQVRSLFCQLNSVSDGRIAFVGGLALNTGMIDELSEALKQKVFVPANPQFVGACGAAIFLKRKMESMLTF